MPITRNTTAVIDLTGDMSDLETLGEARTSSSKRSRETHDCHDKGKKPRQASSLGSTDRRRDYHHHHHHHHHHHRQPKLIGEPWSVKTGMFTSMKSDRAGESKGIETFYKAVQYGKMLIEVDSLITYSSDIGGTSPRGVVRRIVKRSFEKHGTETFCHVHWLGPSDCGQSQEVFLKHKCCADIKLRHIRQVQPLDIGPRQVFGDHAFLRHVYEHAYEVWRDPLLVDQDGNPVCDSCQTSTKSSLRRVDNTWIVDRIPYHRHDFVLIKGTGLVWEVGQIIEVKRDGFVVQVLTRYSDWAKSNPKSAGFISEKRLLLSSEERSISANDVLGKVYVTFDKDITTGPGERSFFCHDRVVDSVLIPLSKPIRTCPTCVDHEVTNELSYREFKQKVSLPAIDYYSGGGGGMIGGKDFFHHAHAVEMDGRACETLESNFPGTTVHCCLVSEAHDAAKGRNKHHLIDRRDLEVEGDRHRRRVRSLPKAGSMVLASAGPPCQGHTGANHHNQVTDVRNDELFVTINEIGRLRPDIFILENVPMMKRDREGENEGVGNYAVEGIRRLRGLGYQVRLVQLDSRSFGSPQNRTRLFIICARKGVPLPSIPEPTHANPELIMNVFDSGGAVTSRSFYVGTKGEAGSAPLPSVTVRDAISDLPPWEYIHASPSIRGAKRIPQFSATTPRDGPSRVGFLKPVPYGKAASNDYQMSQRGDIQLVSNHYTPLRSERELALVVAAHIESGDKMPGNARRITADGGAHTLLTTSNPGGKYTGPIHYDQVRTLTVAERKRIQGVPDNYILVGNVHDKDRQVGNMINVHLSRALHGHIHREVFFPAWLKMGRPDDFLARWRELHPV